MMWVSVLLAGFLGLLVWGPPGALLGLAIGFWVGRHFSAGAARVRPDPAARMRTQTAFFRATFVVMGYLAKADGYINEKEIRQATRLMERMHLTPAQRRQAIELFNRGKSRQIDIDVVLREFSQSVSSRDLLHVFIEIQLQAAYADGVMSHAESVVLHEVCRKLHINSFVFEMLHRRFLAQQAFFGQRGGDGAGHDQRNYQRAYNQFRTRRNALADAYKTLGVSSSASDAEVKRVYRKRMSDHHPDKLISKGLPDEMLQVAKQKTQEIQAAYDEIRKHRKRGG